MKICYFCLQALDMLAHDSIFLQCNHCKPTPYVYKNTQGIWSIQFKLTYNEDKYFLMQEVDDDKISIYKIFYIYEAKKEKELYNPFKPLKEMSLCCKLTPANAQNILERTLNLKAFL